MSELPELLVVREVAELFRIRPETVRRMIADGELRAVRFGSRGDYRIPRSVVQRFLEVEA